VQTGARISCRGLPCGHNRRAHARELGSQFVPWELGLARVVIIRQLFEIEDDPDPAAAQR